MNRKVQDPLSPQERGRAGMLKRLSRENWGEMTSAANQSANHVSRLGRWIAKAREEDPDLTDDQAEQRAAELRDAHYKHMQQLSVEARRPKEESQ